MFFFVFFCFSFFHLGGLGPVDFVEVCRASLEALWFHEDGAVLHLMRKVRFQVRSLPLSGEEGVCCVLGCLCGVVLLCLLCVLCVVYSHPISFPLSLFIV